MPSLTPSSPVRSAEERPDRGGGSRTRPLAHADRPGIRVSPGPGRIPALDGLRGVAVLAVLVFHAWPALLPGGFVGVDMFFVLSGFLITTGLVRGVDGGRGLRLGPFWMRRVRRLVPSMVVALVCCTALAWLAVAEFPAGLGRQWLGALTYTSNWVMILSGSDYFAAATPPLFEHLWSLAIEEQFYVLWPLVVAGLLTLFWPREPTRRGAFRADRARVLTVLALAAASAVWMAVGLRGGAPHTRLYFGTDTHAFGLLLGAAVALMLAHTRRPEHGGAVMRNPPVRSAIAWGLFAALLAAFVLVDGREDVTYLGVLAGLSLVVTLLLFHVVQGNRQDSFSRAMSGDVLRWWGRRSYAAYLWHWPLLVILRTALPVDAPAWVDPVAAGGVLLLTAGIADLSTRWMEEPIVQRGFRGAFAHWRAGLRTATRGIGGKAAAGVAGLALVAVPVAAVAAVVHSPAETALQRQIAEAEAALEQARQAQAAARAEASARAEAERAGAAEEAVAKDSEEDAPGAGTGEDAGSAAPTASSTPSDTAAPSAGEDPAVEVAADPTASAEPEPTAEPEPEPPLTGDPSVTRPAFTGAELTEPMPPSSVGPDVTLLGDSVALSAAPELLAALPGIAVEAEVGFQVRDAAARLAELDEAGMLTDVVVVSLGANGNAELGDWDRILAAAGPERLLVLVVPHGPMDWIGPAQQEMAEQAALHPDRVVLADWDAASAHVDEWSADGVHPKGNGQGIYARLVRLTVEARLGLR